MNIVIPEPLLAQIPAMADAVRAIFRGPRGQTEQAVGVFRWDYRSVPVLACRPIFEKGDRSLGNYQPIGDYISIFERVRNDELPSIVVERVLAHELAHAIDRQRLIKIWRWRNSYKKSAFAEKNEIGSFLRREQRSRIKYACRRTEFDAEMASIMQVGLPHVLKQGHADKIFEDYFGNKNIYPLTNYKPLWPLTYNRYIEAWSHSARLSAEFFNSLSAALATACPERIRHRLCLPRIIRVCSTKRIQSLSPQASLSAPSLRPSCQRS